MTEQASAETPAPNSLSAGLQNSLSSVVENLNFGNLFGNGNYGGTASAMSQTDSQYLNLRYYLISNNRQLLSQMYVEHGIVQTLVDQPVDDAFRAGYDIKTGQLDADDLEQLQKWMHSSGAFQAYAQATKWKRLFGGGGVLIMTTQKAAEPFNIEKINKFSRIAFKACDMWELYCNKIDMHDSSLQGTSANATKDNVLDSDYYDYYGVRVDPSRVLKLVGKEAPSFIRIRLRGWGMSEIERLVRSLNQYMKNQDVIYDLLDEAKIDIFRIEGLNDSMIDKDGVARVTRRIQTANMLKNYNNALTMDMNDEYSQKQITFAGLSDILEQVRITIASDVKMPLTKLFGQSAAGFSSGEDDIENYNSMLESEIRAKSSDDVIKLLQIGCKKLFDFIPDDLQVIFRPLRILSSEQEEKVKDSEWKRTKEVYETGLMTDIEAKESINAASLTPVEIDETTPADDPLSARSAMSIAENDPMLGHNGGPPLKDKKKAADKKAKK